MLECNGAVVEVSQEDGIDKITSLSGSGPAYVFHFIEAMEKKALSYGFSEKEAKEIATKTVYGSAKLANESSLSSTTLRENVTSPNGTTQAALEVLMNDDNGLKDLLGKAIEAAKIRSEELSN